MNNKKKKKKKTAIWRRINKQTTSMSINIVPTSFVTFGFMNMKKYNRFFFARAID